MVLGEGATRYKIGGVHMVRGGAEMCNSRRKK